MPVSGNEEAKVLGRKSSDISAGIPLKKRRSLLVPPPSPPRDEYPSALSEVKNNKDSTSDLKHKGEVELDCKEKEESCSELENKEKYGGDVKHREATGSDVLNDVKSPPDLKDKEESCSELENKEKYGGDVKHREATGSDVLNDVKSPPDLKDKEEPLPDQGPASVCVANQSSIVGKKIDLLEVKREIVSATSVNLSKLDMDVSGPKLPEVRHVDELVSASTDESITNLLLLSGKSAASEIPGTTGDAISVSVKKEMESSRMTDCNLKLSTGDDQTKLVPKEFLLSGFGYQITQTDINDSLHPSVLCLSLSKESDTSLSKDGKIAHGNRSNWDLNTTMDAWEGSILQGNADGSTKTTYSNNGKLMPVTSVFSEKGKQVLNEPRSSFPNSSTQLIQHPEDSLQLTLSSSFQEMEFDRMVCGLSVNRVLDEQSGFESSMNTKMSCRVIKSEPTDENSKLCLAGPSAISNEILDFNSLKREPSGDAQVLKLTANNSHNLTAQKCIKSEPTSEVCQGMCGAQDLTLQQSLTAKFVDPQESGSSPSILTMPVTPSNPSPPRLRTSSELSTSAEISNQSEHYVHELSMCAEISNQSEHYVHNKELHFGNDVIAQPNVSPIPGERDEILAGITEVSNVDSFDKRGKEHLHDLPIDSNVDNFDKRGKEHLHDLPIDGEGLVSDEEKINISAEIMEDESYGSDYESDGNQAFGSRLGKHRRMRDDDEYEDGEVREHHGHSKIEDPAAGEIDMETAMHNDCPSSFPSDTDRCQLDVRDNELKIHDDMTTANISQNVGVVPNENNCNLLSGPLQNLPCDGMASNHADKKEASNSYQGKSGDNSGDKSSIEGIDRDMSCDGASSGGRIVRTRSEALGEMVKALNTTEEADLSLAAGEVSSNGTNAAAKDSTGGGNRSRIINLPRAFAPSPTKTRLIPDKLLCSRNGRDRYSDLDVDKSFPRTRDEMDTDSPHRFGRDRIQERSFRHSRVNYARGRGRFSGRLETSRSEWGSNRDFTLGSYNDDYRFTRNKRDVIPDTEIDCDGYVVARDGVGLTTSRGRKSLNDDLPSFRHPSSRRFSPGVRDSHAVRGVEMLRRIPRNISPSRRNDESGIGLVSVQHDEKFVRVLPDDMIDHAYTRQHCMYEGGDSQFIRGNRNFSAFQRRGFPRVRSKSPVGSRTRSPGPWSSPRRRSPNGFVLSHVSQHRSPAMYGVERMRSPDRTCFHEQMVVRRRGSPSYLSRPSNDSRDVDSGREHGHPRHINPSRRSPDRVLNRNSRRLDDLDPRIRTIDDEYFGRPVHSGRFQEFHADESSDERRKCTERRGLTRPFRPPYIHSNDGPRPLKFCSDADTEFTERNTRDREFDGQMKNRAIITPRRIRSIDDQEGSYRHAGRIWHDDAFNEGSGFKRRRF